MPRGGKRDGAGRPREIKPDDKKKGVSFEELSLRKQKYLSGRASGKTKYQAALDAGYAETTARTAKQHIETDDVREAFARLIQSVIPAEKVVARIAEGMDAIETKFYAFQGMVFDREDCVAWTERREYTKLAAEYGQYFVPTSKTEGEVDHKHSGNVSVTVEFIGAEA